MGEFTTSSKLENDWYLNSSRAKLQVAQPDRFYLVFIYNTLHNHLYHMDTDSILVNMQTLEPVAVMEWIKGLDRQITNFKMPVYTIIAKSLNIPFFIINWDKSRGVQVTDVFSSTTKFQTWQEHARWLRDLKYSTPPNATPHSEACDCYKCLPELKS